MFAHLYGIKPWEWERLTVEQTLVLQHEADAWVQSQKGD